MVFVLFELISLWMIVTNDLFINASFFNTSNQVVASSLEMSGMVDNYIGLQQVNEQLVAENTRLQQEIRALRQSVYDVNTLRIGDAVIIGQYQYNYAKVIDNTTQWLHNYITLNKGKNDGIAPGMGVINESGVVGKVQAVSNHYAVVASLLHNDLMVSSKIKRLGTFGTTNWSGANPLLANLNYIPRHVQPQVGDTIVTSGYNAVFPEGIMVGTIADVNLADDENFHNIKIQLSNDFSTISWVYVIENQLLPEKDSIEMFHQSTPNE